MEFSSDFACPVIVRIHAEHDLDSEEHVDARAHDVHCAGYLLFYLLTSLPYLMPLEVSDDDDDDAATWAAVAEKQLSWVSCTILSMFSSRGHFMCAASSGMWERHQYAIAQRQPCAFAKCTHCLCWYAHQVQSRWASSAQRQMPGVLLQAPKPARLKAPELTVTQCWLL